MFGPLLTLVLVLTAVVPASEVQAQNVLAVSDTSVNAGAADAVIPITLAVNQDLTALVFDITFSPALCAALANPGAIVVRSAGRTAVSPQEEPVSCSSGAIRVAVLSLSGDTVIAQGSGVVFEIDLGAVKGNAGGTFRLMPVNIDAHRGPLTVPIAGAPGTLTIVGATTTTTTRTTTTTTRTTTTRTTTTTTRTTPTTTSLGPTTTTTRTTTTSERTTTTTTTSTTTTSGPALTTTTATSTTTTHTTIPGDNAPPDCSGAGATPQELWPPNHRFVAVTVAGVVDPDGDPVTVTVTGVTQDEPRDEGGDAVAPSATGVGTDVAHLRAERDGRGDGRVYHVSFEADDGRGGACRGTVTVCVPHGRGGGHDCVDEGPLVDATGPTCNTDEAACGITLALASARCTQEREPAALRRQMTKVHLFLARAMSARSARQAKRFVAGLRKSLARAYRLVARAETEGAISGNCAQLLGERVGSAEARAQRWLGAP